MQICREIQGDPISYGPLRGMVRAGLGNRAASVGGHGPHRAPIAALGIALALAAAAGTASADDGEPPPQGPVALPYTGDLDGDHLFLGPVGAAVQIEGAWDSAFGATVTWLRVRERRPLAVGGATVAASRYAARDGGRLWAEAAIGTRRIPGGVLVGASAGPAVELGTVQHPRWGATGSVWLFAGVVPFVRGGVVAEAGTWVELGVALQLPAHRW
jgi:hypothetical protein